MAAVDAYFRTRLDHPFDFVSAEVLSGNMEAAYAYLSVRQWLPRS